jgi:hypothetical protein
MFMRRYYAHDRSVRLPCAYVVCKTVHVLPWIQTHDEIILQHDI